MTRLVNAVIGIIETAFILRLVLELLGADATSQFVGWLYEITNRLAYPFLASFPVISIGGNSVLDLPIIIAMIGYAILGWLIVLALSFIFRAINSQ